jgi:hypothetical protein
MAARWAPACLRARIRGTTMGATRGCSSAGREVVCGLNRRRACERRPCSPGSGRAAPSQHPRCQRITHAAQRTVLAVALRLARASVPNPERWADGRGRCGRVSPPAAGRRGGGCDLRPSRAGGPTEVTRGALPSRSRGCRRIGRPRSAGGFVPLPGQGPLLTWRALACTTMPTLRHWDLSLGDVELF